ncbi:hypothetical protein GCM10027075_61200 [Streptomyces heilongjiangensis]
MAVAQMSEGKQGLPPRTQAPPSGAETPAVCPQTSGEEAQGRAGHVQPRWVDRHTKPLVGTGSSWSKTHLPGDSPVCQPN